MNSFSNMTNMSESNILPRSNTLELESFVDNLINYQSEFNKDASITGRVGIII